MDSKLRLVPKKLLTSDETAVLLRDIAISLNKELDRKRKKSLLYRLRYRIFCLIKGWEFVND